MNKPSTSPLAINLLVLVGLVAAFLWLFSTVGVQQQSSALSGSDFNPGRIIDDEIFFDDRAMSVSQIQNFLNARVPNCDTNGDRMHSSGMTRRQWAQQNSNRDNPPYTCLKDYRENVPSVSNSASNLCTRNISGGNKSAAQIIHDVGRACGINPQVLIVMLQKEQSLITDDWPWQRQYDRAMGYACPDSGPNFSANCDSSYYGFFNQVYNAAQAFKRYEANPGRYNYRANRNNYIQYHPNPSCGGSNVFIENQATANLYIYTPYQPNQAALNNLYGTGNSCSAYGNRNFWRMFNDWFGPTIRPKITWQRLDGNSDKTGERAVVGFRLNERPSSDVRIDFTISSPSNARIVSSSTVRIRPGDWNKPRQNTITIAGRNNSALNGTFEYELVPTRVRTSDSKFNGVGPSQIGNIPLVQLDNNSEPNVYRLYNEDTQLHLFTASKRDRDAKLNDSDETWRDEGTRFSYCYTGNQTIFRLSLGNQSRLVVDGSKDHREAETAGFIHENADFAVSTQGTVPVYWRYNPSTGNSLYTTSETEATSGGWEDRGVAFKACEPDLLSVYRLYRSSTQSHLFTISPTERDRAISEHGFRYEGLGFYSCDNGDVAFYRLFRISNGNHIYTTSRSERDNARRNLGFRDEGVKFRLCSDHERDVYRLYNPRTTNHFYTISSSERDHARRNLGFRDEGVKFQVK